MPLDQRYHKSDHPWSSASVVVPSMKMGKIRQRRLIRRATNGRRRKPGQPSIRRRWLNRGVTFAVQYCGVPTKGILVLSFSGLLMTGGEYGAFDRVYSFHCLHWALNQPAALKNVARLLKPGGECLLVFHASLQAMDVCRNITKIERWSKYAPVIDRFVPVTQDMDDCERIEYASKLLKEAGLSPSMLELPRCTVFDGCSLETLMGVYITLNPVADILPDEEKMAAVKDTVELIRTMHSSDDDKARYRVYVIKASKM
ncbi:juvenile hormone acid O-methyltransferase-like isoform X4 [Dermacentor albipictus]|uniref:juvenile hormone acid O-methyltransferase-like isoform X4 n=1 Tax=Dermacentor albipictus TaxID=60249 RepID=UPI0038FCF8C3